MLASSSVFANNHLDYYKAKTANNNAVLTLEPNRSHVFTGESVTFICDMREGQDTDWWYKINKDGQEFVGFSEHKRFTLQPLATGDSGEYQCIGIYKPRRPKATLSADKTAIPVGGSVTLTCSVQESSSWKYYWYRKEKDSEPLTTEDDDPNSNKISVSQEGLHWCRGVRGDSVYYTESSLISFCHKVLSSLCIGSGKVCQKQSDRVAELDVRMGRTSLCVLVLFLLSTLLYHGHAQDAVLTLEPNRSHVFTGESVTFICDMREGQDTDWWYNINWNGQEFVRNSGHKRYTLQSLATGDSGEYQCIGIHKHYTYHKRKSNKVTLTVSAVKPKATLSAYPTAIPAGGRVTLTCSVEGSSDWKYYWYRQTTDSDTLSMEDGVLNLNRAISVSDGGLYWCRGGRGEPIFFTQDSDAISINRIVSDRAVVTLQPNWPQIYNGETITLRCEIQGGDTEWEYEWRTTNSYKPPKQNEYRISSAYSYHSGDYECKGRQRSGQQSSTEWSSAFKLTVKSYKPTPVLTVSPVWLSPGASVTLSCEVEGSSAGWRFYWYKAVPKLSDNSYTYELLPGSNDGTAEGSYILHGPTHTGGYMCRAGRGDPVFYSRDSEPKFILSGDRRSSASVTVSPNRTQHFSSESVSLSCEGNSTEWTVKRFTEEGYLTHCSSNWGSMTGSKCNIDSIWTSAVYWCESGSGEFSNAVNITGQCAFQDGSLILLSPVHPVTEGDSVTLGCKSRTEPLRYNVDFYRNDKLIQNETTGEMTIHAVSKSDEGFYKCKYSRTESPQSWMAVKYKPTPVLTVSPVWLSPGASVTLSCEVEGSSAGWRFYWYKAVPKLSDNSYTYELLPGSNDGTAEGSYILHGPTHTGRYMCTAGRGDPVFYTHNSKPKFIWSGDRRSSASVTVSPNRTQHFSSESVSLSCEGNSTEWRVKRFTEEGYLTHCSSYWGSMTGSKCNIIDIRSSAVYWCESGSGEFSNAVNITGQSGSLILVSPVHPVTEGDSVTLGCKSRTEPLLSNVDFYQNDKLIQNETTGEMTIHAVSKSDEGFYKCKYSRTESPQSWMAVKFAVSRPASSSFPVWLIIGLVTVILLIILLLLLCLCRKSKDPCCGRPIQSQSTNQGSTTDQREDQENGRTPLHGDAYVYESIKGSEDTENGGPADESNDITYSSIELKNVHKKVKHVDPAESSVYSDVKIGSTTEESNVTYAQVYHQNKGKAKDNKELSTPAEIQDTVYSEVKAKTPLDP
uniref:Fc receptor-like protein 5 n=1 Tax=Centroberyx gerrardi TaxID=166262 RepID=UPI003AACAF4C